MIKQIIFRIRDQEFASSEYYSKNRSLPIRFYVNEIEMQTKLADKNIGIFLGRRGGRGISTANKFRSQVLLWTGVSNKQRKIGRIQWYETRREFYLSSEGWKNVKTKCMKRRGQPRMRNEQATFFLLFLERCRGGKKPLETPSFRLLFFPSFNYATWWEFARAYAPWPGELCPIFDKCLKFKEERKGNRFVSI